MCLNSSDSIRHQPVEEISGWSSLAIGSGLVYMASTSRINVCTCEEGGKGGERWREGVREASDLWYAV